jgi:protein gp37
MGKNSAIAWCDHTFAPWFGCTEVGPECDDCYARLLSERHGWAVWGRETVRPISAPSTWLELLAWHRAAVREGVRRRVFVSELSDVFEDRRDLDHPRAWLWPLLAATPGLDYLLLTKRAHAIHRLVPPAWHTTWPAHVWIGATVGHPKSVPQLRSLRMLPAPIRFLSCEPLLAPLPGLDLTGIHWVIFGGKSGRRWRTGILDLAALAAGVAQCDASGTAVFVKQDSGLFPGQQGRIPAALWRRKEWPRP